ncbi:MAG: anthranilate phosphoribosyltransferase [Candidatus Melainabacteria bacterium]|nr:anthranilate phosphoribosyltransferase [Candidatus Melainabacteria bacterium]
MLKERIEKLLVREDLSQEESSLAIHELMSEANPHQIAAFLVLMRAKGETVDELQGIIEAMGNFMKPVRTSFAVLDIVGTGGDGAHTLNISTASAILAASMGVKVAKHGNRSVSSLCGSADVLEALHLPIDNNPEEVAQAIETLGFGFMFAPRFHPALMHLKEVRKGLNLRTVFNIIGPFLNPARAEHLMLGVFNEKLLDIAAALLLRLKTKRSFVFCGCGIDELSTIGPAKVIEVTENAVRAFILDPQEFGLKRCTLDDLRGKDAQYNAQKILSALEGDASTFADTIALNAGVAAYIYGAVDSIQKGIDLAQEHLRDKKALALLKRMQNL